MSTCADLLATTKNRYLLSGSSDVRNQLAADFTAGQTVLAFKYPLAGIVQGATLTIGLDVFYVWSADSSSQTCVVSGGQQGSTALNHNNGDTVYVNPRYTDFSVFTALNEELTALSSPATGLFQVSQTEFAYSATKVGYDLPGVTGVTSVLEVRYDDNLPFTRTPRINPNAWSLERNYLVGENSSGVSLKLREGGYPGRNITVLYKQGFAQFAALTDNTTVTGMPVTALDIPPMGAALRLGVTREVRRNDTTRQGDSRRAEEVPPGAVAGSWTALRQTYLRRIAEESARLKAQYPLVMP